MCNFIQTRQRLVDFVVKIYTQIINNYNKQWQTNPNNSVIHLAITYIDIVLSQNQIPKSELKSIALSCLSIASKFDELDTEIPLAKEFIRFSCLELNYDEFIK